MAKFLIQDWRIEISQKKDYASTVNELLIT
ncbi:hypothetical protein BOSE62_150419 [Bosea sp. 62]|nr:hypothetical protein BOSE46_10424 [Bosea sp. 46]CAD5250294.1 hypothetical protein BOSE21B_10637 [Bosea sp. 21B]CAD5264881.1 hypothetical protein BOSE7B_150499 [Bosea sp. 7B]VVT44325.1 hypothetical protein BOS5A_10434 [Bosea sp. EC-HK365B]VXB09947.1 hypothetical protein BOSE29B_10420 [Bosea sp. 29B]VXB82392.1 hypothetical protein BOSE62_150419 [Bosea sp. 62]VXC32240.1 hypothetical protein BOSE125_20103 [Bosea sp. 125]VXC44714.1 hypothetical protein BOSE127_190126 [Bosea sp. 127]